MFTFDNVLAVISLFELSVAIECDGICGAAEEVVDRIMASDECQDIINPAWTTGPMFRDVVNVITAYYADSF